MELCIIRHRSNIFQSMGRKSTKACLLYLSYKLVPFPLSVSSPYER